MPGGGGSGPKHIRWASTARQRRFASDCSVSTLSAEEQVPLFRFAIGCEVSSKERMRQEAQKNAGPGAALLGAVMRDGSFSQPRQQWTARTVVPNVANGVADVTHGLGEWRNNVLQGFGGMASLQWPSAPQEQAASSAAQPRPQPSSGRMAPVAQHKEEAATAAPPAKNAAKPPAQPAGGAGGRTHQGVLKAATAAHATALPAAAKPPAQPKTPAQGVPKGVTAAHATMLPAAKVPPHRPPLPEAPLPAAEADSSSWISRKPGLASLFAPTVFKYARMQTA